MTIGIVIEISLMQIEATIVKRETIAPAWWRLVISVPDLTSNPLPGQFFLLRCADPFTCYLRRPIFPRYLEDNQVSLLLRPDSDPGMVWLSARQEGDKLDLIGPLGTGFALPDNVGGNLLLVSDHQMIAPLLGQMERAIAVGFSVTLALESKRAITLYPVAALPPVVEFQTATLDGSMGYHGPIIDLLPDLLRWADMVCTVGSMELYRMLKRQVKEVRLGAYKSFLYGLVAENLMACGVGACLSCTIETEAGLKLMCADGPVFDLTKLEL